MFTIGVDPDMHTPALALLENGRCRNAALGRVSASLTGAEAVAEASKLLPVLAADLVKGWLQEPESALVAVEGQQFYGAKGRARPQDLINLAQVAGAACAALSPWAERILIPLPQQWKGSIPKKVKHKRILNKLGWSFHEGRVVVPAACPLDVDFPPSKWTHVIDAIGLAQWGERVSHGKYRHRP